MAATKAALKAIKSAIDAGDYEKAVERATAVVSEDKKNYHGFMFLGFAQEKLKYFNDAEKALQAALTLRPQDIQALKGLITLYDQQGASQLQQHHDIVHQLAKVYADLEDRGQCQDVVDKYELFARKYGSQKQYRKALQLLLPTCDLYDTLEGRIPHPSLTYLRILESAEAEEEDWIRSQIEERRTRLGARIDQVTREVKYEALSTFGIEEKYQAAIEWTIDDDFRHELEEKLLRRAYESLQAVPQDMKASQRDKVLTTANGMVIIKHQFSLAWRVALEWVDAEDLTEWNVDIFREYIEFFPEEGLAKVLRGFLDSKASPFPIADTAQDSEEAPEKLSEADQLIIMMQGLEDEPNSMLAHRIVAHTYLRFEEDQNATEIARKALKLYRRAQVDFALDLQNSIDAVNITLANALITFQAPRHHPEAKILFQQVLDRKPTFTVALLGIGLIFEEDEDYGEAVRFLNQALQRDPDNIHIGLEHAWCHALYHDLGKGLQDLEDVLTRIGAQEQPNLEMKAETLYRIAYCKWHIDTTPAARKDKSGAYHYLINAIKLNPSYAPAYTLLGIYFQDYGKSKQRARVALQKAFELSTSELVAAERLARAFANSGEWDLVELVAQRVVDSGKARPAPGSKKKAVSWPYAALGVVQINRQQYSQSIVSFQAALRISPQDYHSWVGLGESYHNSGRYVAASRAFNQAESLGRTLESHESWFAKYMLANVQREVGAFDDAIRAYEAVLEIRKDEFGVLLALLQTCAENAWAKIAQGLFGYAVSLAQKAVDIAQQLVYQNPNTFNVWKSISDIWSALGQAKKFAAAVDVSATVTLLQTGMVESSFAALIDVDKIDLGLLTDGNIDTADKFLFAAVLANKRAIHTASQDIHARAVSWHNLGWTEYEVYVATNFRFASKKTRPVRYLKAAVRCFKKAIELESSNSDFWNALGVVTLTLNPKISQHSLVRSLYLNERSARGWTNLGVLYLVSGDATLANEAFTRAQSADPEYAAAWVGQGVLALLYGSSKEAHSLFLHAFEISDSYSIPVKRYYATSAFDHLLQNASAESELSGVLQPLFSLRQLQCQQPFDIVSSHLLSLFGERIDEFGTASHSLEEVCSIAEAEYEKTESEDFLVRYAEAKADLARIELGLGKYEKAVADAETAIDLSSEELGTAHASSRTRWRLSAHVTAGLAHSRLGFIDRSVDMFRVALEESDHAPDIVCMLAQVLWAGGGQQGRDKAREHLFACVENHPEHVQAVSLLATIGLLDQDQDVLDAVADDLKGLRASDKVRMIEKLEVSKILAGIIFCQQKTTSAESVIISDALQGIMLSPAQPQGWLELAQLTEDENAADMALATAKNQIPPNGLLGADELGRAYAATRRAEDAQVATLLAPWLQASTTVSSS